MEGVGARLGRSSTRYGPTTVFTGPVRKWKKRWVRVFPSFNNSAHNGAQFHSNPNSNGTATASGATNGNHSRSHLLLYKWTPLTQSNNSNTSNKDSGIALANDDAPEPQRRKSKYVPVALLETQRLEDDEQKIDNEVKPSSGEGIADGQVSTSSGVDEKPDINESPKESQDDGQVVRQDLNESTLDLCLGLNLHDHDSESKPEELGETQSVQVDDSVLS